jgi:hypothetical protein
MFVAMRFEALQYDGTNGATIADWLENAELVRADAEMLVLAVEMDFTFEVEVPLDAYVVRTEGARFYSVHAPGDFATRWHVLPGAS